MAYVAFGSAKGSPGVTTTVAALAATWPRDRDLVVAELDPAGGDLVVRFDLAAEPGLVSLAAAGRRELARSTFVHHTQSLPRAPGSGAEGSEGVAARRVLVGPVAADQAGAALAALRGALPGVLASLGADVLVDCGRLDPGSAAHDVASDADLLVVVARPVVAEVHHLAARLTTLRPRAVSLLLVGDRPYSVAEVADAVGANPLGTLPVDDRAAAALTVGRPNTLRVLRRSRLMRDAGALAQGLADWLPPLRTRPPAPAAQSPRGAAAPVAPPPPATPGPAIPPPPPGSPPVPPSSNGQARRRSRRRPAPPPAGGPAPSAPSPAPDPPAVSGGPKHFRRDRDEERR
jgi:MinD-like ATPase involved in chromosome partitioning or flagellar assembly